MCVASALLQRLIDALNSPMKRVTTVFFGCPKKGNRAIHVAQMQTVMLSHSALTTHDDWVGIRRAHARVVLCLADK